MKTILFCTLIILIASMGTTTANTQIEPPKDSARLAELDQYWTELSRTVREGDFEGYAATYHEDAVVIFAAGTNKTSLPIATALAGWKQGFQDTKAGKVNSDVSFRFSQRIGSETTAHETGIFFYTSGDATGENTSSHITHFEMLFVKRDGAWIGLMEYQKSDATEDEWEALK